MKLVRLIQRPIFRPFSSSSSSSSSSPVELSNLLTAKKPEPLPQIISILEKSDSIEPALDRVAHILNPDIVSTVIDYQPNPQLGFRFFIWAMKRKQLLTWKLNDLIANMIVKENGGFGLWWETLEELHRCGIDIPSDAFLVLVLGYWKAGDAEKAIESFGISNGRTASNGFTWMNHELYKVFAMKILMIPMNDGTKPCNDCRSFDSVEQRQSKICVGFFMIFIWDSYRPSIVKTIVVWQR